MSDRIYAYLDSYKEQGLKEGIADSIIKVTGNPIVDIIKDYEHLFDEGPEYLSENVKSFINSEEFVLVTSHRRENIFDKDSFENIINLINSTNFKVVFQWVILLKEYLKILI